MDSSKIKNTQFVQEIIAGFKQNPKRIKSIYFYDEQGDKLFQQIMELPEYYLTNCEREIFETKKRQIYEHICPDGKPFNLIELGAGDASKTKVLLQYFLQKGIDFTYYPVDISQHILEELVATLQRELPGLEVKPLQMDYFEALSKMGEFPNRKNITLFLGSNIGNFDSLQVHEFLSGLYSNFKPNDKLFLGIDLKKNPQIILDAYNDQKGITAQFNYNLLHRMNRELGSDFDTTKFQHHPLYDPSSGEAKSFLVSLENQEIYFSDIDFRLTLAKGESIHTEISRKYSVKDIQKLAPVNGFKVERNFFDSRQYYVNSMWEVK